MDKKAALLAVVLAVVGLLALLWPVVSGHRLQGDMSETSQEFLEEADQSYPELLADLQGYNQRIYTERQAGLADALACEEPAVLLRDYGVEDEIIGVLEIPTLELVMPVYLGASDSHLAAGAAVLGNTSAPIGGVNTNCVIAGHRGWYGADYFRHIDRLQAGDTMWSVCARRGRTGTMTCGQSGAKRKPRQHKAVGVNSFIQHQLPIQRLLF